MPYNLFVLQDSAFIPTKFKEARNKAKLTQKAAADAVYRKPLSVISWENGDRSIDKAAFELFMIKLGEHPAYGLKSVDGVSETIAKICDLEREIAILKDLLEFKDQQGEIV